MLLCEVESPKFRKPKLTCNNGTGCKEYVVHWHHRRCIVEFRGLIQEPRAEGTTEALAFGTLSNKLPITSRNACSLATTTKGKEVR